MDKFTRNPPFTFAAHHTGPVPEQQRRQRTPASTQSPRVDTVAVNAGMHRLAAAPDPHVVFGQLAELIVPAVCDEADVDVLTDLRLARWIEQPSYAGDVPTAYQPAGAEQGSSSASFQVTVHTFGAEPTDLSHEYLTALTCRWTDGYQPRPADVALLKLLARCAAGAVQQAQGQARLVAEQHTVAHLQQALDSNRRIGAAIGIVMARRRYTYEQAIAALTRTSQTVNRKLVDIASGVLYTGDLPAEPGPRHLGAR